MHHTAPQIPLSFPAGCGPPLRDPMRRPRSLHFLLAPGHMSVFRHSEHRGDTGRQTCCPNPTRSQLISLHRSLWRRAGVRLAGHRERCTVIAK
ncbi:hypothetical protein FKM82_022367 [Ascaphus truei]